MRTIGKEKVLHGDTYPRPQVHSMSSSIFASLGPRRSIAYPYSGALPLVVRG